MKRGAYVEINLNNIKLNYELLKRITAGRPVIAVVKADAYGHGIERVSSLLESLDVYALGVAFISEGIILRKSGIKKPIIVFFENSNPEEIIRYRLTPVVYNERMAREISSIALKTNQCLDVHINMDTGMGRLGFIFERDIGKIRNILSLKGVKVKGIMSHFSEADLSDRTFAEFQLKDFLDLKERLDSLSRETIWHIANSAAVLSYKDSYLNAVRPGLMLYGYSPLKKDSNNNGNLRPAMNVKTKLIDIRSIPAGKTISYGRTFRTKRDSMIGVLPVGYGDGYIRLLSNRSSVIVRGKLAPVIGRVCMDVTMIDLTDIENVSLDDEVILLGYDNSEVISADDLAEKSNTISYEVLTLFGRINEKVYIHN